MRNRVILFVLLSLVFSLFMAVGVSAYYDDYYYDGYYYDDYDYDDYYYDETYENEENPSDNSSDEFDWGQSILIALGVGLVIALIITGIMRSSMKSVRFNNAAANYIVRGSMNITRSRDMYLYSTVTKIPKPQNNNNRK